METSETLGLIEDKNFLDKIYQFSYHRCNTSVEAEDLCSDIIVAVIAAIQKQDHIENFYAFVWTIARRVYADHSRRRSAERQMCSIENNDLGLEARENEIDAFIEEADDLEQINRIFEEIAFLSRTYREVMVLYYIDELKVKDIARRLNISETTVKQRLFSARNSIRKEVKMMNKRTHVLKPVRLMNMGTGQPCGNDPCFKAERMLSQNLIYLCKGRPRSAKELSEELCVPMPYIEEELAIQCCGTNGRYGMLRRLENGKYAVNIHLVDYDEYDEANKIYEKHLPGFCQVIRDILRQNEDKILSFPYLSAQSDLRFILWLLIPRIAWDFEERINKVLAEKYFADVTPVERAFSCVAVAYTDEQKLDLGFYGCDGINAAAVGGYRHVWVSNIYGGRIGKHFDCRHNLSQDQKLLMTLRAIGGICVDELSETEKEIAAKALECGYLRKNGNIIEPKIIVIDRKNQGDFYNLSSEFDDGMDDVIEQTAAELSAFMRSHIPGHLMNEYQIYTKLIAGVRALSRTIDACIREGLLAQPADRNGAEGILMSVEK